MVLLSENDLISDLRLVRSSDSRVAGFLLLGIQIKRNNSR